MKLKLRRIAVVLTAALPLAAATIPTKAEAFGFLLAPALLGSALLGAGAFGGGGYGGSGYGGGDYAYGGGGYGGGGYGRVGSGGGRWGWWLVRQLSTKSACARRIAC